MKNIVKIFSTVILVFMLSITAFAHSGRTDANGGHYDRKTGTYHYHNGGSSSSSSSSSSRSNSMTYELPPSATDPSKADPYTVYSFIDEPDLSASTISNYKWIDKNGKKYCLNTDTQKYVSGIKKIDEKVYIFDRNGIMRQGWMQTYRDLYYFGKDGYMLTGKYTIKNREYTFSESGKLVQGYPVSEKIVPIAAYIDDLKFVGGLYANGQNILDRVRKDHFEESDTIIYLKGKLVGSTLGSVPLRIEIINPNGNKETEYLTLNVNSYERELLFIPDTFMSNNHTGNVSVYVDATNTKLASFDYYVEFDNIY